MTASTSPTWPEFRFGVFLAPYHSVRENPVLTYERDFQLIEHLDRLGYEEAWVGEHHSGGLENIASPEVFIAAAAERTRYIRLGSGVVSLPYHNPLMVAERAIQLDYQTRGRFMLGVGPGALPSDASMIGVDPMRIREMMNESLEALVPLVRGEQVTRSTDWFTLSEARVQHPPYSRPGLEMAVAAMVSPAGPRAAGKFGMGLLSLGATSEAGYMALANAWEICEEEAARHHQSVHRRNWRLVGPMHIAETREQAIENVRWGMKDWADYYTNVIALPFDFPAEGFEDQVRTLTETGFAVIGDPDDAIRQIERLQQQSGGAGAFLTMATNWADFPNTLKSYDLFARYVIPHFRRDNVNRVDSMNWVSDNRERFLGTARTARQAAVDSYAREREEK